ncbi:hypothetical protein PRIPAC_79463 [Pristionchus pacificus]|uniref:Uncharacterized protein n=1 Tax=Pristionchus pacificus TaxID=54126 RepID=A0A2A6CKW2_PRIPA|nr:hypothetical protein PRIPAC_79463 [Pristionchus pacificus]|eukprot:PDM78746.1 hypothetical protein PRIPAC_31325 [Pristionchus pacificus]
MPVCSKTAMRVHLLLLSLAAILIDCMPDNMCFPASGTVSAREFLIENQTETVRGCQVLCGDDDKCAAIFYSQPTCILLGGLVANTQCTLPISYPAKQVGGCPVRTNPAAEIGNDPCVQSWNSTAIRIGIPGICAKDGQTYVVRGVDEFGNRITLDDNTMNASIILRYFCAGLCAIFLVLYFNQSRNMWNYTFEATQISIPLIAVGCAVPNDACPCDKLPLVYPDVSNGVATAVGTTGACNLQDDASLNYSLQYYGAKFNNVLEPATFAVEQTRNMTITCKAGIWLLSYLDFSDQAQMLNGTCVPTTLPRQ